MLALVLLSLGSIALVVLRLNPGSGRRIEQYVPRARGSVTFNKDIAPILYNQCAPCHRSGLSAPIELLTYAQAKKHARQIAEVTQSRSMPPWPPEPGYGEFAGDRRLSVDQIGLIQQWVGEGAVEGAPSDLPPRPEWSQKWQLGKPDLVIAMPHPYTLPAAGRDVYRNFVLPIPVTETHYVQAIELLPGSRSVHHAFVLLDRSRNARRTDEQDAEPGFPGMSLPDSVESPPGQFISWQPGKLPTAGSAETIWPLQPNTDLVLQMHLQPTGKPESLSPAVALYFTNTPPSQVVYKMSLSSYRIDIPPGAADYVVEDSYTLPVDAEVLAVLPHAHYLGKEVKGWAALPGGSKRWLLWIKHWDFNWQGDYRYVRPVTLPKGSTLHMRWAFDNSTNNVRNPQDPPVRVRYGENTTNEMAELWFQLRLQKPSDISVMQQDSGPKLLKEVLELNSYRLSLNPNDARAHYRLGQALHYSGDGTGAAEHYRRAIMLDPTLEEAHYNLALLLREQRQFTAAREELETALRLNPQHARAHGLLGFVLSELGDLDGAEHQLRAAVALDPSDSSARNGLTELLNARRRPERPQ